MRADMSQFPTTKNLASWAGLTLGNRESASKRKSTKTMKGNPNIKSALCEAARVAFRSGNTLLVAKYLSYQYKVKSQKVDIALPNW